MCQPYVSSSYFKVVHSTSFIIILYYRFVKRNAIYCFFACVQIPDIAKLGVPHFRAHPTITLLPVHGLTQNNFLCPAANAVHRLHPQHGILPLQSFCDAFILLHLPDNQIQPLLCLFIQICKHYMVPAGQKQLIVG